MGSPASSNDPTETLLAWSTKSFVTFVFDIQDGES